MNKDMPPPPYLVRVPDHIRISGLDRDRWLLVMSAWEGNPVEATPVVARLAAELFADEAYEIGHVYVADVRRDLEQLAALELPARIGAQSIEKPAAAVERTA